MSCMPIVIEVEYFNNDKNMTYRVDVKADLNFYNNYHIDSDIAMIKKIDSEMRIVGDHALFSFFVDSVREYDSNEVDDRIFGYLMEILPGDFYHTILQA